MNYRIVCTIAIIALAYGCHSEKTKAVPKSTNKTDSTEHRIQADPGKTGNYIEVFKLSDKEEWGYDVHIDGQHVIRQENIPGLQTMKGFNTKEDAKKVAEFVLQKIENEIFPPTVSKKELDSLAIHINL